MARSSDPKKQNESDQRFPVIIIGAGVVGTCAAYYLGQQGCPALVIEKGEIASGSSYGNAGLIVPSHAVPLAAPGVMKQGLRWLLDPESPFFIKPRLDFDLMRWLWYFYVACDPEVFRRSIPVLSELNLRSAALYRELAAMKGVDFGYEDKGGIAAYVTRRAFDHADEEIALLNQHGVDTRKLSADEVRDLEPNLAPSVIGGIYYSLDAHLIPDRFVKAMARLAAGQGARFQTETEVLGFEVSGGRAKTVVTTRGNFEADQIVLASGAWSPGVSRDLGLKLLVQAAKGYSITVDMPENAPKIPVHMSESKVIATPMGDKLRFAGTLELAGVDLSINRRRVNAIRRAVRRYLPVSAEDGLVEVWRGLRPLTPDTLPYIGRPRSLENVVVATGHGMKGISMGPVTGKLVAQLITGQTPEIDLAPLRVERFSGS